MYLWNEYILMNSSCLIVRFKYSRAQILFFLPAVKTLAQVLFYFQKDWI